MDGAPRLFTAPTVDVLLNFPSLSIPVFPFPIVPPPAAAPLDCVLALSAVVAVNALDKRDVVRLTGKAGGGMPLASAAAAAAAEAVAVRPRGAEMGGRAVPVRRAAERFMRGVYESAYTACVVAMIRLPSAMQEVSLLDDQAS